MVEMTFWIRKKMWSLYTPGFHKVRVYFVMIDLLHFTIYVGCSCLLFLTGFLVPKKSKLSLLLVFFWYTLSVISWVLPWKKNVKTRAFKPSYFCLSLKGIVRRRLLKKFVDFINLYQARHKSLFWCNMTCTLFKGHCVTREKYRKTICFFKPCCARFTSESIWPLEQ